MFNVSKKPTLCRVGGLCLIALGLSMTACQQEPVTPRNNSNPGYVQSDPTEGDEDQPPKDIGTGGGRRGHAYKSTPVDSVRVNDDQPPKDVGNGGN